MVIDTINFLHLGVLYSQLVVGGHICSNTDSYPYVFKVSFILMLWHVTQVPYWTKACLYENIPPYLLGSAPSTLGFLSQKIVLMQKLLESGQEEHLPYSSLKPFLTSLTFPPALHLQLSFCSDWGSSALGSRSHDCLPGHASTQLPPASCTLTVAAHALDLCLKNHPTDICDM